MAQIIDVVSDATTKVLSEVMKLERTLKR